jgi:ABC-type nitrate/sulfonate/bicarbonate transport system substrate-binding protein
MSTLKVLYRDVDRTPYLFTMRHFARQYGLELELILALPGEPWGERLEGEIVDVIAENYWGLQRLRAKGAPFVTVGSVVNTFTEKLLATGDIHSVTDLKGKKLAIRGVIHTPQALIPRMWLQDIGMDKDVEVVPVPDEEVGRWGHWKWVADGRCQACFITNIYCDEPLAAGLHEVPYDEYYFEGMNVTLTTTEHLAATKHDDVQDLVNAAFDATRAFKSNDPLVLRIMREEAWEPLKEHLDVSDEPALQNLFGMLRDELADAPVPKPEGVLNAHRVIRDSDETRRFNPMLMWDLSFAREAARR